MEWTGLGVLLSHIRELIHEWGELPAVLRWMGTGFIILFIEYQFPRLFIIWFALAALITSFFSIFVPDLLMLQMFIFVVTTFAFYYNRRKIIKVLSPRDILGFFSENLIGKNGASVKTIDSETSQGVIRITGVEWHATSTGDLISRDDPVTVVGRRGPLLFVEPWIMGQSSEVIRLRKLIGKRFILTKTDDGELAVNIRDDYYAAKIYPAGMSPNVGEKVEIRAIGKQYMIVEPIVKDFIMPKDMIGHTGISIESFGKTKYIGSVKIDGVGWRAESLDNRPIKKGQKVKVVEIDGLTLVVELLEKKSAVIDKVS